MHEFYCEADGIYRLRVPFEAIYTSVFLIRREGKSILVDCATTESDVTDVILPALEQLGCPATSLDAIVLTHRHGDHAGGLAALTSCAPQIQVITDIRTLATGLCTYPLAGHTADSIGVLDEATRTLISGDGLQGAGVDRWRCNTREPDAYLQTLGRIRADDRIEHILFSHAYEPWDSDRIDGRLAVLSALLDCSVYVKK